MRVYSDEGRLAILDQAYSNLEPSEAELEAAELDPYRPDVLAHWNSLRPKPLPLPRVPKLDTAKRFDAICDARADARIAQFFKKIFLAEDGFFTDTIARVVAHERDRTAEQLRHLRTKLKTAHARIQSIRARQGRA